MSQGLGFRDRLFLALPQAPLALSSVLIHNAFIKYYTDMVGLEAPLVGLIYFVFSLWNAINDPLLGLVIDRFPFRPGRGRLGYLMRVTFPLVVATSFAMLWAQPGWDEWLIFGYFLGLLFVFDTALSTYSISYSAYLLAVAPGKEERVNVSVIQGYLSFVTSFLGTLIPTLLLVGDGDRTLVIPLFSGVIVINAGLFFLGARHLRAETDPGDSPVPSPPGGAVVGPLARIVGDLATVLGNRAFLALVVYSLLAKGVVTFYFTPFLYFMDHVLRVDGLGATIADVGAGLAVLGLYPLIGRALKRLSWRASLLGALGPAALGYLGLLWADNLWWGGLCFGLITLSLATLMALELPVMGAIIDDDARRTGLPKPGLFNGMRVLLFIPAVGLQTMIFTSVIGWFGYDGAAAQQSARALEGLRLASGGLPLVFLLLGTVPLLWFRLAKGEEVGTPGRGTGSSS